jgi:hypothetical protein
MVQSGCGEGGEAVASAVTDWDVLVEEGGLEGRVRSCLYPVVIREQWNMTLDVFAAELAACQLMEANTAIALPVLAAWHNGKEKKGFFLVPKCQFSLEAFAELHRVQPCQALDVLAVLLKVLEKGGVFHGDLKASNMMVDEHFRIRLIDNGGAVRAGKPFLEELGCRSLKVSHCHASPERTTGGPITMGSELTAAALTVVQMWVGAEAFRKLLVKRVVKLPYQEMEVHAFWPEDCPGRAQQMRKVIDLVNSNGQNSPQTQLLLKLLLMMMFPDPAARCTLEQALSHPVWSGYDWSRVYRPMSWLEGMGISKK